MLEDTPHSNAGDFVKLGELIRDIRVALLTTVDRDGRFHTRPVQTLQVDDDCTVVFHRLEQSEWIASGRTSHLIAAVTAAATGTPAAVVGENRKIK